MVWLQCNRAGSLQKSQSATAVKEPVPAILSRKAQKLVVSFDSVRLQAPCMEGFQLVCGLGTTSDAHGLDVEHLFERCRGTERGDVPAHASRRTGLVPGEPPLERLLGRADVDAAVRNASEAVHGPL